MPKNLQGGSKHKRGSNSESSTSKKNKRLFSNLLSDICEDEDTEGVHIGRVIRKLGEGRMEVMFIANERLETVRAPMKGSIRGRGKKDAWVDVGSFVILNETGLTGSMSHEIVMPLTAQQVTQLRKEGVIDERMVEKISMESGEGDGIEFEAPTAEEKVKEEEKEIDIDTI